MSLVVYEVLSQGYDDCSHHGIYATRDLAEQRLAQLRVEEEEDADRGLASEVRFRAEWLEKLDSGSWKPREPTLMRQHLTNPDTIAWPEFEELECGGFRRDNTRYRVVAVEVLTEVAP